MASGSFLQVDIVCPFYRQDDGVKFITCEGMSGADNVKLYFAKKASFMRQIETFCTNHERCNKCVVHRAIMEKYN